MADLETLGDRLRRRRKSHGMRSRDLASKAGVSQSYVWLIENTRERQPSERRHISRDVLVRWAAALGVERNELQEWLTLADYEPTLTRDEMAILSGDQGGYTTRIPEWSLRYPVGDRPEPKELDSSALRELQERVRDTILRASVTDRHTEAMRLLDSYIDWLSYYVTR